VVSERDQLTVERVQASDSAFGFEEVAPRVEPGIRFDITLRNNSASTTFHATARLHGAHYDDQDRLLTLLFERERSLDEEQLLHFMLPPMIALEPGATAALAVVLPLQLPTADPGNGIIYREIDLTDWKRVEVRVRYAATPYRPIGGESAHEAHARLAAWGDTASRELSRSETIPEEPDRQGGSHGIGK
jgi:hypothetical protein